MAKKRKRSGPQRMSPDGLGLQPESQSDRERTSVRAHSGFNVGATAGFSPGRMREIRIDELQKAPGIVRKSKRSYGSRVTVPSYRVGLVSKGGSAIDDSKARVEAVARGVALRLPNVAPSLPDFGRTASDSDWVRAEEFLDSLLTVHSSLNRKISGFIQQLASMKMPAPDTSGNDNQNK